MRIFGGERMEAMTSKLGMQEGDAITHRWMTRAIEKAQQRVEARNYEIRKNLLKFDDVMNDQRKVIFEQRIELMHEDDLSDTVREMRHDTVEQLVAKHMPANAYADQWETQELQDAVNGLFGVNLPIVEWAKEEGIADQEIRERLIEKVDAAAARKASEIGPELMRQVEKAVLLQTLDHLWREHLVTLELLRQAVGLRGYGQRDPLNEYKREGFIMFEQLLGRLRMAVTEQLMKIQLSPNQPLDLEPEELPEMHASHVDPMTGIEELAADDDKGGRKGNGGVTQLRSRSKAAEVDPKNPDTWGKVPRNATCPCGSGKKYKHCHGALVA
jgi:preprotein translocase subunit SecA